MPLDNKHVDRPLEIDRALNDPAAYFSDPMDVATDQTLSKQLKTKLLQRWEHDAQRLEESATERMEGGEQSKLRRVKLALAAVRDAEEQDIASTLGVAASTLADGIVDVAHAVKDTAALTRDTIVQTRTLIRGWPITAAVLIFGFGYFSGRISEALRPLA